MRYLAVAAGVVCLLAVTTSAGIAGTRHEAQRMRTYSTPGTRPLRTALLDPWSFRADQRQTAFAMAQKAGASYVRLGVRWTAIAPAIRPVGFDAADPSSPGYSWAWLDSTVESVEAAGLTPMLQIASPPAWAAKTTTKKGVTGSTPKIPALRQFATALATRYDGAHGEPQVRVFQVWNEPNLSLDLFPIKASIYRKMVNTVADVVHGVDSANIVVAGGLDPFKNKAKHFRSTAPLAFMRALLCLSKGKHPHRTCKARIRFDVWAHHPYTFGGPFGHARNADDVSLGDLPKMRRLLRSAVRMHHVVSSRKVQFWVTEFGWDTNPPRKHAAPLRLEARWTAESLYQMWRSGVSLATWFLLQDRPKPSPYQSGLFFHSKLLTRARAKPMRQAFRFPFVAYLGRGTVRVWGRDATSDKELVLVQRRHGRRGRWHTVARIRSNRSGIFKANLPLSATRKDWLRATAVGSGKSLAFSLTVPKSKRYGPWGN
jgi:hypothetical protein